MTHRQGLWLSIALSIVTLGIWAIGVLLFVSPITEGKSGLIWGAYYGLPLAMVTVIIVLIVANH